ncbi:MAG: ABC transporter [Rhodospirillum sp.]|nr:ABC transporter [Rhodospirillum sp.]
MPGLGPGIHEFLRGRRAVAGKLVDGKAKPCHDGGV